MSFDQLLDDICRLPPEPNPAPDFDDDLYLPEPEYRVDFAKSMAAVTRKLKRNARRSRRLAKSMATVWDRLTPVGDDQPRRPPDYDAFLERCQQAMAAGEITGHELVMLEGLVNRMKNGMAT